MNYALIISLAALFVSSIGIYNSVKYSKINVFNTLQRLMMERAKDCGEVFHKGYDRISSGFYMSKDDPPRKLTMIPYFQEITTSIKILDISLKQYKQESKRNYFLELFWCQLNPMIQSSIQHCDGFFEKETEIIKSRAKEIQTLFKPFFTPNY